MPVSIKRLFILPGLLLCISTAFAEKGAFVVYPSWFKNSFYDLPSDLRDAQQKGKHGIVVFVSMKTCSYYKAIIETTFQQADIVKRLRANYHVIGLEVFSDVEVVDMKGKSHWAKDFVVQEKAQFTPTMLFYGANGKTQLRLVGYQSPKKFRGALDYLEGGHHNSMKLSDYLHQRKSTATTSTRQTAALNLDHRHANNKPLLVVVESADCTKCQQLRTMLKAPVLQSFIQRLNSVYVNT